MSQLSAISREMSGRSPVFIVGVPRGGTSLLYRTLQKHTRFSPKEIELTETSIFIAAGNSYLIGDDQRNLLDYFLDDRDQYGRFLRSIAGVQGFQRLQKILNPRNIGGRAFGLCEPGKRLWWRLGLSHLVVRSFFYHAQAARGCERIVEKTPVHYTMIPEILSTFPNARILYVYRHPVDVFTSRRRRAGVSGSSRWSLSPQEFCASYRACLETMAKRAEMKDGSILPIKYERFTTEPAAEFLRICQFLGEEMEDDAVVERQPDLNRWKPDPNLFGPIVTKTKQWTEYASEEEARSIETELEVLMKEVGYDPYTDDTADWNSSRKMSSSVEVG